MRPAPQYEFSQLENDTIGKTAFWAKALAITMFVSAALSLFGCNILNVAAYVAIAIPIFMAGNALQKVADTRGSDITYMMEAVQTLGTSFLVRIIALIAMVVLTVVIMLALFLFAASLLAMVFGAAAG